ncbi:DUF3817 domain-containing protein [Actinomadura flavalba]|uniref:DUF3817 domain-containing protein n=1 Tax=Actinomadura flavalba TaxID=1120938 RepID=UPI000373A078|nr:DUF3817 domain-containing protein [Actinomadura flavalba]
MNIVRILRYVSIAEATSFLLLLLVAMPLKYWAEFPIAVSLTGAAHGGLFIAYVGLVVIARGELGWTWGRTLLALVAAVLPVAPYLVERRWIKPVEEARASREVPAGA